MKMSPTKHTAHSDKKFKDHFKDKGASKEAGQKDCGRDKTWKLHSASGGNSSTRSQSGLTLSSSLDSISDCSSFCIQLLRKP